MKLIVWLGNPWTQYEFTRHNLWYLFLDWLKNWENFPEFKLESKFKWIVSTWNIWWEKFLLLKPITYMNLSWESVRKVIDFYKIPIEDIVVIYDDVSMEFGKVRFRETWSAWWHNWIKSLISHIWQDFKRIKVWVWIDERFDLSDWVLSKVKKEELEELEKKVFVKVNDLFF